MKESHKRTDSTQNKEVVHTSCKTILYFKNQPYKFFYDFYPEGREDDSLNDVRTNPRETWSEPGEIEIDGNSKKKKT